MIHNLKVEIKSTKDKMEWHDKHILKNRNNGANITQTIKDQTKHNKNILKTIQDNDMKFYASSSFNTRLLSLCCKSDPRDIPCRQ